MAVYKIFPTKDATIYTQFSLRNTGRDEIIEASTYLANNQAQSSRYLIQFDTNEISDIISNKISGADYKVYLKNYAARVEGLNQETTVEFFPISDDWNMGTGKFTDTPETTNGVSWRYRNSSGSGAWLTGSFPTYVTASFSNSPVNGGCTWYTGSNLGLDITQFQRFSFYEPVDINTDVTNTIINWYTYSLDPSNGIDNNGFLIKQQDSDEFVSDPSYNKVFRFFSRDTNTIYPPELEFRFYDYTFSTGSSSNTILSTPEAFINVFNNVGTYYSESIARFRVAAVEKFPTRVYITSSLYTTNFYLPESQSLYAIKDSETNEYVIPFDSDYTRISADNQSSYFDVYMNGLQPERYYTILIKTTIGGETKVFDEEILFKVING